MKHLLILFAICLLQSCATHPKGFSQLFSAETGKEIRPASPWKSGKSEVRFTNSTEQIVSIRFKDELLLIAAQSSMKFEVEAGQKLTINDILIDQPLLGRNKYEIDYYESD